MAISSYGIPLVVLLVCLCAITINGDSIELASSASIDHHVAGRGLLQSSTIPSASHTATTTRNVSWGQQLKDSITGVLVGIALFLLSFPLLIWNELKAARIYRILTAARKAVRKNVDCDRVDASLNGQLVHSIGRIETPEILRDDEVGVDFPSCVKYRRSVEMYQWVERKRDEEEDKLGGGKEIRTTYTYQQQWSSIAHDSTRFYLSGHDNPTHWPITTRAGSVSVVGFGGSHPQAFVLSRPQIHQIDWYQHRAITEYDHQRMTDTWRSRVTLFPGGVAYLPYAHTSEPPAEGAPPSYQAPNIGDMKISYQEIPTGVVSVMGRQSGSTFLPWIPPRACTCCCADTRDDVDEEAPLLAKEENEAGVTWCDQLRGREDIIYADNGPRSASSMLGNRASENSTWSWSLRLTGYLMMWIGLTLILDPVVTFVKVWPFLSQVIGAGITLACGVVSLPLTLVTISIAWIFARPLVVVALITMAAAIVTVVVYA